MEFLPHYSISNAVFTAFCKAHKTRKDEGSSSGQTPVPEVHLPSFLTM